MSNDASNASPNEDGCFYIPIPISILHNLAGKQVEAAATNSLAASSDRIVVNCLIMRVNGVDGFRVESLSAAKSTRHTSQL